MKTVVVLLLALLAQAGGNMCLSLGMRALGAASPLGGPALVALLLRGLATPTIWLGIGLLGVFFGLYAAVLSWAELSVVLPATAVGYVLNVACGAFVLHEVVAPARWAGAVLIGLGLCCVSWSVRRPALSGSPRGDPCGPC
jgi:drug/metabolite transporter (DMT)-like permease